MKDASNPGQFCQSRMGKCVVPAGWGSWWPFLLHYLLCRALPCLAESGRRGSLAPLLVRWLIPHTKRGWEAPSAGVPAPLAPCSALFSGSWIALQRPSKAPTFPLSKQMGLNGILSLRVELCAFMGTCGFPQTEAPLLCLPFSGRRSSWLNRSQFTILDTIQVRLWTILQHLN